MLRFESPINPELREMSRSFQSPTHSALGWERPRETVPPQGGAVCTVGLRGGEDSSFFNFGESLYLKEKPKERKKDNQRTLEKDSRVLLKLCGLPSSADLEKLRLDGRGKECVRSVSRPTRSKRFATVF